MGEQRAELTETGRKARELLRLVVPNPGAASAWKSECTPRHFTPAQPGEPSTLESLAHDCPGVQEVSRTQGIQNPGLGMPDIDRVTGTLGECAEENKPNLVGGSVEVTPWAWKSRAWIAI